MKADPLGDLDGGQRTLKTGARDNAAAMVHRLKTGATGESRCRCYSATVAELISRGASTFILR